MANAYLDELFGLQGRVAVVIGGTGVLGGALALGLAQAGATVVVSGRDPARGEERVREITDYGQSASFLPVDVMQRESIEQLLAATLSAHGRVDMLINGAGVNSASAYLDVKDEDFDRVIDSNLKAVHWGCQIFGRQMVDQGDGAILNIASASAHLPLSRVFAYSASKAAVVNLTQNVARELAPQGVRVNALCPGFFPAEQNRKLLYNEDGSPTPRAASILSHTPMARFGESRELAGAAVFLASDAASGFVTGVDIRIDGGFLSQTI